jgi:hypothetical protein
MPEPNESVRGETLPHHYDTASVLQKHTRNVKLPLASHEGANHALCTHL